MSIIGVALNLLLATLLVAALGLGLRLNKRLRALRESQEGFAKAVAELDMAAQRAEQGLADLRAATDEASESLADRIEKARELTARLERQLERGPSAAAAAPALAEPPELELNRPVEDRLGLLLAGSRASRPRPTPPPPQRRDRPAARPRPMLEDDLFEEPRERLPISAMLGSRR